MLENSFGRFLKIMLHTLVIKYELFYLFEVYHIYNVKHGNKVILYFTRTVPILRKAYFRMKTELSHLEITTVVQVEE